MYILYLYIFPAQKGTSVRRHALTVLITLQWIQGDKTTKIQAPDILVVVAAKYCETPLAHQVVPDREVEWSYHQALGCWPCGCHLCYICLRCWPRCVYRREVHMEGSSSPTSGQVQAVKVEKKTYIRKWLNVVTLLSFFTVLREIMETVTTPSHTDTDDSPPVVVTTPTVTTVPGLSRTPSVTDTVRTQTSGPSSRSPSSVGPVSSGSSTTPNGRRTP